MGKLFYVIGKSATGKDTIFQKLLENEKSGSEAAGAVHHPSYAGRGGAGGAVSFYE